MSDHWSFYGGFEQVPSGVFEAIADLISRDDPSNTIMLRLGTNDGRAIVVMGTRRFFNDTDRVADDREIVALAKRLQEALNKATEDMS
jgi:hypothetical protein